jgi:glutathione S-transferase
MRRTRGDRLKPVSEEVADKKWEETREKFVTLGGSLKLNDETSEAGPFIMGNQVSFADFAIGGLFYLIKNVEGSDSARLKEMLEWQDGRWSTHRKHIQTIESNSSQVA